MDIHAPLTGVTHWQHAFARCTLHTLSPGIEHADWSDSVRLQDIPGIEADMGEALAMFEAVFPRSELVIMMHLAGHLAQQLKDFGPLRSSWMFPLESFLGFLKKAVKNRAQVSSSLIT